jgi:pimeloyl-ACP methyl ester carboxylesterase
MHCLLLHGLAGEPSDWDAAAALLPGWDARVPRLDYLGADSLDALARDVAAALPTAFLERGFLVAGNSLGGLLALALGRALDGPASPVRRLVLAGTHLRTASGRLDRGNATVRRELERIFHDPGRLSAEQVRRYERTWAAFTGSRQAFRGLRRVKAMIRAFDQAPAWRALQHRTLLLCGRHDRLSPLPWFHELHARYPGLRLRVLERCGHAVPLERPRLLASLLAREAALPCPVPAPALSVPGAAPEARP